MNNPNNRTVSLPADLFEASGTYGHPVNISVGDGVIVILREKLTAFDTLKAYKHISDISSDMIRSVQDACEMCIPHSNGCGNVDEGNGFYDYFELPYVIDGLLGNEKRMAIQNEARDRIASRIGQSEHSLRDVPKDILDLARMMNLCMRDLDLLIRSDIPVYDGEYRNNDDEEDDENE